MSRKITVVNPSTNQPVEIMTDAATWGALIPVLSQNNITTANMKGIVADTKVTLEVNDAVLPEGDFTLYMFTAKNKAGKCQM